MSNYNPAGGGLQYRGTAAAAPPNCLFRTTDPTQYDKNNVSLLDFWLNTTTNDVFVLVSLAGTSSSMGSRATWVKLSTGQIGLFTINGIMPNGAGNISIAGSDPIIITSDQPTSTITIAVAVATTAQIGVTTLANNALTISGTDTTHAVTPVSLAAKLGTQTTNGIAFGAGTAAALSWTAVGTGGQVLMSHNSGVPQFGSLTSTGGTVTITYDNAGNAINFESAGSSAIATVQTVNNTPTTLFSFPVAVNSAVTMYTDIVAAKSDYSAAIGGNISATARRAAGGLIMIGASIVNLNEDSAGSPDFTITTSGNNLIIQVTGEAATTYNWRALVTTDVVNV